MDARSLGELVTAEPFLARLGIEVITATACEATLALRYQPGLSNHAHFLHAGAQFTLGEATAVALVTCVFADHLGAIDVLTAHAGITYLRLARGDLMATCAVSPEECERIRQKWLQTGRARLATMVDIRDTAGAPVTSLAVECVALRRAPTETEGTSDSLLESE